MGIDRYTELIVNDVEIMFENTEINEGGSETGYALFFLDVGDDNLIFVYESMIDDEIFLVLD